LDNKENQNQSFRIAKRMAKERQDITCFNCLKDLLGTLIISEQKIEDMWKQYMAKLMNEENDWDIRLMELDKEIGSGKQRRGL